MTVEEVNPRDVMEQLTVHHAPLRWVPNPPSTRIGEWDGHDVRSEDALAFLHAHHQLPVTAAEVMPGGGLRSRLGRLLARVTLRVLGHRLQEEQDVISRLVEMTEVLAKRCDELTSVVATQQAQEAANQARLAGWLDAALPQPIQPDE